MTRFLSGLLGLALLGGPAAAAEISHSAAGHVFNPTWSGDGRWLSFEINDYEGTNDLYVIEMMSGGQKGSPTKAQLPGARSSFASGGTVAGAAVWHPQGALIFEGSNAGGTTRLFLLSPAPKGRVSSLPGHRSRATSLGRPSRLMGAVSSSSRMCPGRVTSTYGTAGQTPSPGC